MKGCGSYYCFARQISSLSDSYKRNWSNKKFIGFDSIDVEILKHSAEIICKYSCIGGIFPRILKIAKVIPIHKEGKKDSPSNSRPISISGKISEYFEKVIQQRLTRSLETFSLLTENRFGFREKDTVQAATLLWKTIQSNWATKTNGMSVLLDFRKAFDIVDHQFQLQEMNSLGVRGNVSALMATYLADRKQCVNVNSENYNFQPLKRGVPQGSILEPLQFLVYTNDIESNANIIGKL